MSKLLIVIIYLLIYIFINIYLLIINIKYIFINQRINYMLIHMQLWTLKDKKTT